MLDKQGKSSKYCLPGLLTLFSHKILTEKLMKRGLGEHSEVDWKLVQRVVVAQSLTEGW